jgi:hypothetical protein
LAIRFAIAGTFSDIGAHLFLPSTASAAVPRLLASPIETANQRAFYRMVLAMSSSHALSPTWQAVPRVHLAALRGLRAQACVTSCSDE